MAFENRMLSIIAYTNGFSLWQYKSQDTVGKICADGYFASQERLINNGDVMIINGSDTTVIRVAARNKNGVLFMKRISE